MSRLLIIVSLALSPICLVKAARALPSSPTAARQNLIGHVLRYPEAGFSVVLPLTPDVHVTGGHKLFNDAKIEEAREYALYRDRVIYVIRTYVTPTPAKALSELSGYLTHSSTDESGVTIDGVAGRRWQTPTSSNLLFTTKNSILVFEVIARDLAHPEAQRFLTSINFGGETRRNVEAENVTSPSPAAPTVAGGANQARDNLDVFKTSELTRRVFFGYRPEPGYTEAARRDGVHGTVKLRMLLGSDGTVKNITVLAHLPDGLTEKAIAAARRAKFLPAEKDGRPVSTWAQVNYQFSIY